MLHLWYLTMALPTLWPRPTKGMESGEVTRILAILLNDYDKKMRPGYTEGRATRVTVDIEVLGMGDIDDSRMEYSMHCYFRQYWTDTRLSFEKHLRDKNNYTNRHLPLNAQHVLTNIWRPDTYIINGKRSFLHHLTVPNKLLRINRNGDITLSQRLTIIARCPMKLRKFPMDTQNCFLRIGSLGYPSSEIEYVWQKSADPTSLHHGLAVPSSDDPGSLAQMSQFNLDSILTFSDTVESDSQMGKNVSRVLAQFHLIRQQGYYVLQIYIPCTMIVMLSWVSFWINKEAAIARCSLGVMTVLALTTLRLGVRAELPVVHYATALDVFLLASFGFVMAALVEYIIIHFTHLMHVRKISKVWGANFHQGSQRRRRQKRATMAMMKKLAQMNVQRSSVTKSSPSIGLNTPSGLVVSYSPNGASSPSGPIRRRRFATARTPSIAYSDDEPSIQLDGDGEGGIHKTFGVPHKMAVVDVYSKAVFPIVYVAFHCCYWISYIWLIEDDD